MFEVEFSVFGKEACKGGFFGEGTSDIMFRFEFFDLVDSSWSAVGAEVRTRLNRTVQWSVPSTSHGFSFLYVEGIVLIKYQWQHGAPGTYGVSQYTCMVDGCEESSDPPELQQKLYAKHLL